MKKVMLLVVLFGGLALVSCKKEYTCTFANGATTTMNDKDHSQAEIDALKASCDLLDGTWSE
ncbi:MAG: hypothetical protein WC994_03475 [Brumimicrobium sp.]